MEGELFEVEPDYRTKLLIKSGFIKKKIRDKNYHFDKEIKEWVPNEGCEVDPSDAEEEEVEMAYRREYGKTGFPVPKKSYRLAWEVPDLSLEETYFWFLEALRESYLIVEKLEDSFSAAENSAFFGVTQQRLGAQQDKVSQFLITIGKMIKELFQMVRELRIIDERLEYYSEVESQFSKPLAERSKSSEITLKGLFVDLAQQGAKSAASVFGMARELEFVTLPDLFFDAPPFKSVEELDRHVKSLEADFNSSVLRVLQRHLRQYMEWKKRTHQEHANRKRFMLSYLQQHFDIIQMYINWLKPYLRHVARLTLNEKNMSSPDIISSFEGSMLDIEVLFRKREPDTKMNGCILMTYHYRTRAEMKVVQEGYQRGPVHIGKMETQMRLYIWSDEQVQQYKNLKKAETLVLMGQISSSVKEAMDSLGKELTHYLEEAKGVKKEEKNEPGGGQKSFAEKFFGDFYTPKQRKAESKKAKGSKIGEDLIEAAKKSLLKHSQSACWNTYKNFKKAHKMLAW